MFSRQFQEFAGNSEVKPQSLSMTNLVVPKRMGIYTWALSSVSECVVSGWQPRSQAAEAQSTQPPQAVPDPRGSPWKGQRLDSSSGEHCRLLIVLLPKRPLQNQTQVSSTSDTEVCHRHHLVKSVTAKSPSKRTTAECPGASAHLPHCGRPTSAMSKGRLRKAGQKAEAKGLRMMWSHHQKGFLTS